MTNIAGKRLLVSGGILTACSIVRKAREMGVYTMVTDYLEDSPAKRIADESFMVSTTDIDAMVKLVQNKNVDGVITGFIDSNLHNVQTICERVGLPFYATKEQLDFATNKDKFKQVCRNFRIPVVEEYKQDNMFNPQDIDLIKYPVIVKPVDNSGARGIYKCNTKEELKENYKKALSFSKSKHVIVERYMTGDEVVIYYTIQDGYVSLSAMCDRYTNKEQPGVAQIPTAYIYPSKYLELYQDTLDKDVKKMFKAIGLENGVLFIQSFVENNNFYFYEIGFRLNGAQEFRLVSRVNGINTLEMMINYALTGKMSGWDVKEYDNPNFGKWCCKLTPIAKPGKIGKIIGLEEVAKYPEVVDIVPVNYEGDIIQAEEMGTLRQIITRIFIIAPDKQTLSSIIDKIYATVKVISVEGDDMLLSGFNTELIDY